MPPARRQIYYFAYIYKLFALYNITYIFERNKRKNNQNLMAERLYFAKVLARIDKVDITIKQ